jgi:hypothetical protein
VGYELLQMLSYIFDEPVSKYNLQSVLERQKGFNFSFVDKSIQRNNNISDNIIGCINLGSDQPKKTSNKSPLKNDTNLPNQQIAKIKKLRKCGLSDEEIADILDISSLEVFKNIEIE